MFFVTTNLSKNLCNFSPSEYDLLLRILNDVRSATGFLLIGDVLMPDHAHLLFITRLATMSHIMHQWKFKTGYAVQQLRGRCGPMWQPRYFDFICGRRRDVIEKLNYIHHNPVTENLVEFAYEWKWSTAGFYVKQAPAILQPDQVDISGDPNELLWPAPYQAL